MIGRNPSKIIRYLEQELEGLEFVATPDENNYGLSVTLNRSEDDDDLGIGAYDAKDGGFMVRFLGTRRVGQRASDEPGANLPSAQNPAHGQSEVILKMGIQLQLEFSYSVGGVTGSRLRFGKIELAEQACRALMAVLQPAEGGQSFGVSSGPDIGRPYRHPVSTGFYVQEIAFSINEFMEA